MFPSSPNVAISVVSSVNNRNRIYYVGLGAFTIIVSVAWLIHGRPSPWTFNTRTSSVGGRMDGGGIYEYMKGPNGALTSQRSVYFGFVNLSPSTIAQKLREWDEETSSVPRGAGCLLDKHGNSFWEFHPELAQGLWHVCATLEGQAPIALASQLGHPSPDRTLPEYLDFSIHYPHEEKEVWQLNGPLQGALYIPLKHFLSTCAIYPNPNHPDIRPRLDIPVIVGKDAEGKDIIVMKPLITKVVNDDGDPVQVSTGNKKEDQYFDKKFNSP